MPRSLASRSVVPGPVTRKSATPPKAEPDPGYLPADGVAYPLVLRNEYGVWWRSMLGVLFGLSLYLLLSSVVSQAVVRLAWVVHHPVDYRTYYTQAFAYERPVGLLGSNLGLATLIPIAMVLVLVLHRVRTRWLFSVGPGIRWRYLLICLGTSVVGFGLVQALAEVVASSGRLSPQPGFWAFLAVIVLTSPIQAAAEEIFFRGYVTQAMGSIVARPWFGVIASSVVFALLHGSQNLALFVNRLAFGLLAGVMVWWVGGLEAGIAAHVMNNVIGFVWAGLTSSIAALKAVPGVIVVLVVDAEAKLESLLRGQAELRSSVGDDRKR